jgi:hypothetical protein
MRLRYFQAEDPFAAASERSERAFNAMCLPPPSAALSAADADADATSASSCAAGGAPSVGGLARQVCDAMAPQPHAEVVVDSRPQAAFQAAMAKARKKRARVL